MNHIALRGAAGEVRQAYHRAAEIGAWTIDNGRLTGEIATSDPFRLSQSPLTFLVRRPGGVVWSWVLSDLSLDGTALSATIETAPGGAPV